MHATTVHGYRCRVEVHSTADRHARCSVGRIHDGARLVARSGCQFVQLSVRAAVSTRRRRTNRPGRRASRVGSTSSPGRRPCRGCRMACRATPDRRRRVDRPADAGSLRPARVLRSRSRRRSRCGTRRRRRVSRPTAETRGEPDHRSPRPWRRSFAGTRPTPSSSLNQGRGGPRTTRRPACHRTRPRQTASTSHHRCRSSR